MGFITARFKEWIITVLKIKKLKDGAVIPKRATEESAGLDLSALLENPVTINPHEIVKIPTGIAIELEKGYAGLIYPRSGLSTKHGISLANCVGVVDSDYRGEVLVAVINHSETPFTINTGERIAQLVISPVILPEIEVTNNLNDTERGVGGFGSTGIN